MIVFVRLNSRNSLLLEDTSICLYITKQLYDVKFLQNIMMWITEQANGINFTRDL